MKRAQKAPSLAAGVFILVLIVASPLLNRSSAAGAKLSPEIGSLFVPTDGTITIKAGNYIGPSTTETAKFSKQIFSSTDCSTGGGSIDTVNRR